MARASADSAGRCACRSSDELAQECRHRLAPTLRGPAPGEPAEDRGARGDREQRRDAGRVVCSALVQRLRRRLLDERVRERQREVAERQQLEPRLREPAPEPRERRALRGPRDDEAGAAEQLRGGDRSQGGGERGGEGGELERLVTPEEAATAP